MEGIINVVNVVLNYKAYVMLPIVIFILGIIIRMKIVDAFISSIKIGVGFSGIFLAFDFFIKNIGPAINQLLQVRGLDYNVLDVGWPPLAAITWSFSMASLTIPIILLLNIIMLAMNWTKTINIDIWNYWHFALLGTLVLNTTNQMSLGLLAVVLVGVYAIKLADWSAPYVEKEAGLEGVCITTLTGSGIFPLGVVGNKLIDKIPVLNELELNPDHMNKRFKVLGEPILIGFVVGIFLGYFSGYELKKILELSIHISTVMYLLPICGESISNGLKPVTLKLKKNIQHIFPNKKKLNIGMSTFVLMKNSSVLLTGLILMPISLIIAFILPGNKMIPLGDLVNLLSAMSLIALSTRGNVLRSVIIGIPIVTSYLLIATQLAPLFTKLSMQTGLDIKNNYDGLISSFTAGGNPIRYYFLLLFNGNIIALSLIPVFLIILYITWKIIKSN